jgi:hypothetical protein
MEKGFLADVGGPSAHDAIERGKQELRPADEKKSVGPDVQQAQLQECLTLLRSPQDEQKYVKRSHRFFSRNRL